MLAVHVKPPLQPDMRRYYDDFTIDLEPQIVNRGSAAQPVRWTLRARVRQLYELTPSRIDFGEFSQLVSPMPVRHHRLTCMVPVHAIDVRGEGFAVAVEKVPNSEGQYDLVIEPNKPLPLGPINGRLNLTFHRPKDPPLNAKVLVKAYVARDIEASLPALFLGERKVGTCCEETVVLSSRTGRKFTASIEGVTGPELSAECQKVGDTDWRLVVSQKVTTAGVQTGAIRVQIAYAGKDVPNEEVTVPVRVEGIK